MRALQPIRVSKLKLMGCKERDQRQSRKLLKLTANSCYLVGGFCRGSKCNIKQKQGHSAGPWTPIITSLCGPPFFLDLYLSV